MVVFFDCTVRVRKGGFIYLVQNDDRHPHLSQINILRKLSYGQFTLYHRNHTTYSLGHWLCWI